MIDYNCKNNENVICLTEGLLIKKLVDKFPKALAFLKEIELETLRNHDSEVDEWYDHFFFDENLKKEIEFSEMRLHSGPQYRKLRIE